MTSTAQEWPTNSRGDAVTGTRPYTEDSRDDATGTTTLSVKRACNGCGGVLGDVSPEELSAVMGEAQLPDVRGECLRCTPADAPAAPTPS